MRVTVLSVKIMCRRFSLLANIENATIDQFQAFVKGSSRMYVLLTVLSFANIFLDLKSTGLLILSILGAFLYACCTATYYLIVSKSTADNCLLSVVATILLLMLKIVSFIYSIFLGNVTSVASSIISTIIQMSTIYILVKFRSKILSTTDSAPPDTTDDYQLWAGGSSSTP